MSRLTVDDIDDELNGRICSLAEREGLSPSQAALRLLRRGAGLTEAPAPREKVGPQRDDLFGTWTKEEGDEFDAAIEEICEVIDEEMWR